MIVQAAMLTTSLRQLSDAACDSAANPEAQTRA